MSNKINNAYKFRLYPNREQEQKLLWVLDKCRFVYNYLLEKKREKLLKRNELQALLPKLKREFPELQDVHSKTLQCENYKLHRSIFALYQMKRNGKKIGKLRYRGRSRFKSFIYNQSGFKIIQTENRHDKLHLSKIGDIPFIMHREIEGKIKQITVKRYSSGKWCAIIVCEKELEAPKPQSNNNKVGIDLGIINYAYDSNGNHFDNPKNLDKSMKKLKKRHQKLSRKQKGSNNREKQKTRVARVYEKIVSQRSDFLHKLSHHYTSNYGFIAVENLDIKGLIGISYNAKNIMNASWSKFVRMLCYKAERAGCTVVKVVPRGTTQKCSNCGKIIEKNIWNRMHMCECGLQIDRDYNSAINILNRALGREPPEVTPVETGPLPSGKSVFESGS